MVNRKHKWFDFNPFFFEQQPCESFQILPHDNGLHWNNGAQGKHWIDHYVVPNNGQHLCAKRVIHCKRDEKVQCVEILELIKVNKVCTKQLGLDSYYVVI